MRPSRMLDLRGLFKRRQQTADDVAEQTGCSEPRDGVSVAWRMSVARVADPGRSAVPSILRT